MQGADLSKQERTEVCGRFARLFNEEGLVVFRDQALSPDRLLAAAQIFGGPVLHPAVDNTADDAPGVTVVSNQGDDLLGAQVQPDELVGEVGWHSDEAYTTSPNRGKLLYAVESPAIGGETGFVDGARLYADLPDSVKEAVVGLSIINSWNHARDTIRRNQQFRRHGRKMMAEDRFPDVGTPLVRPHPISGELILNVSPLWASRIAGLPADDSERLLTYLRDRVAGSAHRYWHSYRPGDVVVWDNWRFLHCVRGTLRRHRRVLWAVVIRGGPTLGVTFPHAA